MNDSNLFWVALQSNLLVDLNDVSVGFKETVEEMKKDLSSKGWIFPTLQTNMRNQVNIANVKFEKGDNSNFEMKNAIEKSKSGSSLVGQVPVLFRVQYYDWSRKRCEVLHHCIELMGQKNDNNIVVLFDTDDGIHNAADYLKKVITDKKVIAYPSRKKEYNYFINEEKNILKNQTDEEIKNELEEMKIQIQKESISHIHDFVQNNCHILVTKNHYFNGCEASNVIFVTVHPESVRNSLLRGVQETICIQILYSAEPKIYGMKEDDRFLDPASIP